MPLSKPNTSATYTTPEDKQLQLWPSYTAVLKVVHLWTVWTK